MLEQPASFGTQPLLYRWVHPPAELQRGIRLTAGYAENERDLNTAQYTFKYTTTKLTV